MKPKFLTFSMGGIVYNLYFAEADGPNMITVGT